MVSLRVVKLLAGGSTCIGLDSLMGDCPGEAGRGGRQLRQ